MGGREVKLPLRHLSARGSTQAIAPYQGGEFRQVGNCSVHRTRRAWFAALVMLLRLALIIPTIGEIVGEVIAPAQAGASHA
jgi:hypothetical protein